MKLERWLGTISVRVASVLVKKNRYRIDSFEFYNGFIEKNIANLRAINGFR